MAQISEEIIPICIPQRSLRNSLGGTTLLPVGTEVPRWALGWPLLTGSHRKPPRTCRGRCWDTLMPPVKQTKYYFYPSTKYTTYRVSTERLLPDPQVAAPVRSWYPVYSAVCRPISDCDSIVFLWKRQAHDNIKMSSLPCCITNSE